MIEPDTIIDGRYRVISRLGSGGMADVYLAQDQLLGRHLAVKVLHHHFAEDHEFVERFKREASSAAALSHPNIVGIFDRGEWNGTYYIAMEYVAGRSLKAIIREDGALDPVNAIDIVVQILRAARFAHRRGVIHRDLKPHNVILDEEGRARVTDFGIARAGASDMTLTGSVMGTAQYLSPEQAQGFAVSSASDLYSVGVILYELLTGVVPFEGESAVAIAYKQVSAAPRPPGELNPVIPPSLDAVVMRALAKDPAQRYSDADELIVALEHEREVLRAYQGAAIPASYPIGATALAEPPATGSMLVVPPMGPPAEEEPPDEENGRRRWWLWPVLAAVLVAAIAAVLLLTEATKQVTVPRVVGQTEQSAILALRRAGLQANPTLAPSVRVATGLVVTQAPPAGSAASKGSTVKIVVSGGPANVSLPDVHGLHATEASDRLHGAGFIPEIHNTASPTVPAGVVIGTEPPAGTVDRQGSTVTVLVSSGPALITVPDVTGESLSSAQAAIANAGLANGTVTRQPSSSQAPGAVLSQEPKAGSEVRSNTKINLVVAEAPKTKKVAVPTVVGRTELSAEETLERAGLSSSVSSVVTGESADVGKVLRQSPSGGTHLPKGGTVKIFVGVSGGRLDPDHNHADDHHPHDPQPERAPGAVTSTNGHHRDRPLRVAVLAGGRSSEHEVSLSSGRAVRDGLLAAGHEVLWVEISREGEWHHDGELLSPTPGRGLLGADVAFPVLHGPFGEDGTVQGMLETLGIPYVGSGVAASAVSLDKVLFKELMRAAGVPQVDFVGLSVPEDPGSAEDAGAGILERLGLPVFVKPAHLGSSVGIVKVEAPEELAAAIEQAFDHDERVIVEAAAGGREVECAVIGGPVGPPEGSSQDAPATLASPLGEIVFGGQFYDYEAKYSPGGMQLIVPARISPTAERRARELALEVFAASGCQGLARVDFFVDGEEVLVNELNTMPGFTPTSVYAKLIEAAGISYPELVERLCRLGLERHRRLAALRR